MVNVLLDAMTGGGRVLARLEQKLDGHGDRLSVIQSDVAALKAKDGEAHARNSQFFGEEWPLVRQMVQETARQLAVNVETVGTLARSVESLQSRMDRGEGHIAELRGLQEAVKSLRETDAKVSLDVEGLKKTVTRWGGGLAVVIGGATVVWTMLPFKVVTEPNPVQPNPAQIQAPVYVLPPQAPASGQGNGNSRLNR